MTEREERRRYRKIHTRIYGDERFRRLSKPHPNGQTLFLYMLTGPHTTNVPGLSSAGERMLAERLEWSLQSFRRVVGEVTRAKMVFVDWSAPLIWLPKAIIYNEPESPNVVKAWAPTFDEFPECPLKATAGGRLRAYLRTRFGPAFEAALSQGWPKATAQPYDNQEQEPEPDPDKSLPPPKARRSFRAVENVTNDASEGLQADQLQATLRDCENGDSRSAVDERCGMESAHERQAGEMGLPGASSGHARSGYECSRIQPTAHDGSTASRLCGSTGTSTADAVSEGIQNEQSGGMGHRDGAPRRSGFTGLAAIAGKGHA